MFRGKFRVRRLKKGQRYVGSVISKWWNTLGWGRSTRVQVVMQTRIPARSFLLLRVRLTGLTLRWRGGNRRLNIILKLVVVRVNRWARLGGRGRRVIIVTFSTLTFRRWCRKRRRFS